MTAPALLDSTQVAYARFLGLLGKAGVRAALAHVLALSDYRYLSVFRVRDGRAHAVIHLDRQEPDQVVVPDLPESATYCYYVRDTEGMFVTRDAGHDDRLVGHPARDSVLAYCGIPIIDAEGVFLGTLCHYDNVPRDPAQLDLALLMQVAAALERGGHVPPCPPTATHGA